MTTEKDITPSSSTPLSFEIKDFKIWEVFRRKSEDLGCEAHSKSVSRECAPWPPFRTASASVRIFMTAS